MKWFKRAGRVRVVAVIGKAAALGALVLAGFVLSASVALTPSTEDVAPVMPATRTASLSATGTDPVTTGSLGDVFSSEVFAGPNRAAKRDRAKPETNVLTIASLFDSMRQKLSAVSFHYADPETDPAGGERVEDAAPRISIAVADPAQLSDALMAIQDASGLPAPRAIPQQLAYARANTPATVFDTPTSMKVSDKQFNCLAEAVYFEARGESYRGQAAVAQVVLNRVKHKLYPSTICSVVYQNKSKRNACQFSFACDGIPEHISEPKAWATAKEVARKVLDGEIYLTEVANATHYHATYVYPQWAARMKKMTQIGLHIFYRFRSS